ncbi:hypothetical protein D3C71_1608360 [compost metagenome]
MNLFWISFAYQEDNGGSVRRGVVRQTFNPVFINTPALSDGVYVVGKRQGDHVRFDPVDDRGSLFTGAAMRLANHHVIPGLLLVMRRERFVVLIVKLTRRIVRHVQ